CRCCSCCSRSPCWSPYSPATSSSRGWIRAPGRRGEPAMTGLIAAAPGTRRAGARMWTAVRRSPKAAVGLAIFLVFCLLAAFPQLFPSVRRPMACCQYPSRLPPSGSHLLGTTQLGQDIYAQLVYGTRESLLIALIAGFFATVLSVLIGVSAAYLGGIADDLLSLVTNVFLILPTFPLIIILSEYAGNGSLTVVLIVLVAT